MKQSLESKIQNGGIKSSAGKFEVRSISMFGQDHGNYLIGVYFKQTGDLVYEEWSAGANKAVDLHEELTKDVRENPRKYLEMIH